VTAFVPYSTLYSSRLIFTLHQENVFPGAEVTRLPLVPFNPWVHYPAPRSCRFTRILGLWSWFTLPLPQRYLVHTSLVSGIYGPHFPRPSDPWYTCRLSRLSNILALPLLSYLAPPSYTFSTPGPLPHSVLSHPSLSPLSLSLRVFDFNHLLFLASPPLGNLILSLFFPVFLRPFFTRSVSPWFSLAISYPSYYLRSAFRVASPRS